jgi:hypothetical protein
MVQLNLALRRKYTMDNKDVFAEYAVLVLKELFDSFPVAIRFNKEEHLGKATFYPAAPFEIFTGFRTMVTGIYIGPDRGCRDFCVNEKEEKIKWNNFDWESCQKEAESLLQRELLDQEKADLLLDGVRPYTACESQQLKEWRAKIKTFEESCDQQKLKENIYFGTVQFLVSEGYIRIVDIPERINMKKQPSDVMIEKTFNILRFVLTNKGYIHMNRQPPVGEGSLYDIMKSYVANKTVDAFAGAGAGTLLTVFLS